MSLITTETLAALWRDAHSKEGGEPEACSFWQHVLSKHYFKEEHFICDAEIRPEPGSRRRIDRGVRFVGTDGVVIVLLWLEAKGDSSNPSLRAAEQQALDACKRNLNSHNQAFIYALTTGKTCAKAWTYEKGDPNLAPLDSDSYIEANSSDGGIISKWFERMRKFSPAAMAGDPRATRITMAQSSTNPSRHEAHPTRSSAIFPRHEAQSTRSKPVPSRHEAQSAVSSPVPSKDEARLGQITAIPSRHKAQPTVDDIKSRCTRVPKARRDQRNRNAVMIGDQSVQGWLPVGDGPDRIMYCQSKSLWMFPGDVRE